MAETPLRIGVVGLPDGWSTVALCDAVESRTGFRLLIDPEEIAFDVTAGTVTFAGLDLCELDGVIVKKVGVAYSPDLLDRLEILRFLSERGVRVFSDPIKMIRLLDRLSCTVSLASAGLPMPPTVVTESVDVAVEAVRRFETAVFKPLYSTKARGMRLISDGDDAHVEDEIRLFRDDGNPVMYIQRKIEIPGRDLGIAFLGGRYVGTYARRSGDGSWNTTIHAGGRYEAHEPSDDVREVAHRAQAAFALDFTTVDVAETVDGPVVFEVSAFGGFRGLRDALGIDAAALYADYAIERIRDE